MAYWCGHRDLLHEKVLDLLYLTGRESSSAFIPSAIMRRFEVLL